MQNLPEINILMESKTNTWHIFMQHLKESQHQFRYYKFLVGNL